MYRLEERHLAWICDRPVEFEVRRVAELSHPLFGTGSWLVEVILRGDETIHGGDVRARLLDRSFAPFVSQPCGMDLFNLPQLRTHGISFSHKIVLFGAVAGHRPGHLVLDVFGHERIFALFDEQEGGGGTGRRDEGGTGRRDEGGDKGKEKKEAKKCCLDKFSTPEGEQPTRR